METKKKIKLSFYKITLLVTWVVCLLVLAVGYFGFYQPQQEMLDRSKHALTESNDMLMLAQRAAKPEARQALQQRCDKSYQSLKDYSVHEDDMTDLVFEIGQKANQLGLAEYSSNIKERTPTSTVEKSESLQENWLTVEFTASFQQFAQFLNELERNHPVVFIEKINFQRDNQAISQNEIRMELSFLATKQDEAGSVAYAKSR